MSLRLVEVHWLDAFELSGWMDTRELDVSLAKRQNKGVPCTTVGYIVEDKDDIIVLAQTNQPEEDNPEFSNLMIIPKSMIIKVIEKVDKVA